MSDGRMSSPAEALTSSHLNRLRPGQHRSTRVRHIELAAEVAVSPNRATPRPAASGNMRRLPLPSRSSSRTSPVRYRGRLPFVRGYFFRLRWLRIILFAPIAPTPPYSSLSRLHLHPVASDLVVELVAFVGAGEAPCSVRNVSASNNVAWRISSLSAA